MKKDGKDAKKKNGEEKKRGEGKEDKDWKGSEPLQVRDISLPEDRAVIRKR